MMDTSKTYIKMCDCEDIQGQHEPWNLPWSSGVCHHNQDTYFQEVYEVTYGNKPSERKVIWLPTQDQLQEMVKQGKPISLVDDLNYFCFPVDRLGVMPHKKAMEDAEKREEYIASFTSMEQLWLAFVMKEKHNKVWNGEEWNDISV